MPAGHWHSTAFVSVDQSEIHSHQPWMSHPMRMLPVMMVGLMAHPYEGVKFGNFTLCHGHTFNIHLWPCHVWNFQLLASFCSPQPPRAPQSASCALSCPQLSSTLLSCAVARTSLLSWPWASPSWAPPSPSTELPVLSQYPWHNLGQLSYLIPDSICRLTCGTQGPLAFLSIPTHPSSLCGCWAPSLGVFTVPSARDSDLHLDNHTHLWAAF